MISSMRPEPGFAAAMSRRLVVVVVVALLGLAAPALARADATISGIVSDPSGAPLAGACVSVFAGTADTIVGSAQTAADGSYSIEIPAGTYTVQFEGCGTNADFAEQWYPYEPTQATATPLTLADGTSDSLIDAELQPGGQVVVQVVDADTGAPIDGGTVALYRLGTTEAQPVFVNFATHTPGTGPVAITGLQTGTYLLGLVGAPGDEARSWYPNVPDPGHSQLISVDDGLTTTLSQPLMAFHGGAISGTVTGSGRALAHAQVGVEMREPDGSVYGSTGASTQPDGQYTIGAVAPGTWSVMATAGRHRVPQAKSATVAEDGNGLLDFSLPRGPGPSTVPIVPTMHAVKVTRRGRVVTISGRTSERGRVRGYVTVSFGHLLPGRRTLRLATFTGRRRAFEVRFTLPRRHLLHPRLFIHLRGAGRFGPGRIERRVPHRRARHHTRHRGRR